MIPSRPAAAFGEPVVPVAAEFISACIFSVKAIESRSPMFGARSAMVSGWSGFIGLTLFVDNHESIAALS